MKEVIISDCVLETRDGNIDLKNVLHRVKDDGKAELLSCPYSSLTPCGQGCALFDIGQVQIPGAVGEQVVEAVRCNQIPIGKLVHAQTNDKKAN